MGRQPELDALLALLATGRLGCGGLVLISGEPGIGKTRLVQELGERAHAQEWRVINGRTTDVEGAPAYLPVIEALHDYVDVCPSETLRSQLGQGASGVALLLPGCLADPSWPASWTALCAGCLSRSAERLYHSYRIEAMLAACLFDGQATAAAGVEPVAIKHWLEPGMSASSTMTGVIESITRSNAAGAACICGTEGG
jgi:AAA ATPase domain